MKLTRLSMMAALAAALAVPSIAQRGFGGPGGDRNRLTFLDGYLDLTDAQVTQATEIFNAAQTASETARGALESAKTALTTAVKAKQSDSELDRLSAAVGVVHGQLEAIHAKAEVKFRAILTAEQLTKYDELRSRTRTTDSGN